MKGKFLLTALSLSLIGLGLSPLAAQAQDKGLLPNELSDPSHSELNLTEDKTLLVEHEPKPKPTSRDSVMVNDKPSLITPVTDRSKNSEHKTPGNKEDDDELSFNFLYYIIQKFKISDLIDE